jgi:hypothetical protein
MTRERELCELSGSLAARYRAYFVVVSGLVWA